MEIILQGQADNYTLEIAKYYLQCDLVNKVIISCWENDNPDFNNICDYIDAYEIIVIKNKDVENPGIGNRNRQIKSSYEGLIKSKDISIKTRSDQKISKNSLYLMYDFFLENYTRNKIFCAGIFTPYPFHPRDHIFMGYSHDLINLFNIPYCILPYNNIKDESQYVNYIRAETYIGQYYYARFDKEIDNYINNPKEYLVDNAPQINKALQKTKDLYNVSFCTMPEIDIEWLKYGYGRYPYSVNAYREIWHGK